MKKRARAPVLRVEFLEERSLLSFAAPLSYPVDEYPNNLAAADLNQDGVPDLVVTSDDSSPGTVDILLGNGDGTFRRGATYRVGLSPYGAAVADFNGDGQLDLAVANRLSQTVTILLGNGDGTFRAGNTLAFNGYPYMVVAGDFNQDGNLDLAAVGEDNGGVGIFLGNGDGTFRAARYYPTGSTPLGMAVADFNDDGILDLATANAGDYSGTSGSVSVLLGNGDGSFGARTDYVTGLRTQSVTAGDLNGDGIPDLVAANTWGQTVSVLLGNGDGTFRFGDVYSTPPSPRTVVLADVNNDGRLDVVAANPYGNAVTVLLGNGDGTFQAPRDYLTGALPQAVLAADVTGDGRLDLVTANYANESVTVLPGNGDGTFLSIPNSPAGTNPNSLVMGDFTNDSLPDLAVAGLSLVDNEPSSVTILAGQGNGTFRVVNTFPVGLGTLRLVAGDFNGDGNLDLAVTYSGSIGGGHDPGGLEVFLGNGDGTFQPPQSYPVGFRPVSLVATDVNGDDRLDLVEEDAQINVLLGNGDGTFQAARTLDIPRVPAVLAAADLNHDGIPDLVGFGPGINTISVLLGNGDGTFQPAMTFDTGGLPRGVVIADFDGDGNLDLAVSVEVGPRYTDPGQVSVLRGNGDGTFQPPLSFPTPAMPENLAVGDFNGDGVPDLAVLTYPGLSVFLGNGDGSFQPGPTYATGGAVALAVGDFTGGPLPDVATVDIAVRVFPNAADWAPRSALPARTRSRLVLEAAAARALPGGSDRSLVWFVRMDAVSDLLVPAHESLTAGGSYVGTWPPDEGARVTPRPSLRPKWLAAAATASALPDEDNPDLCGPLLGRGDLI